MSLYHKIHLFKNADQLIQYKNKDHIEIFLSHIFNLQMGLYQVPGQGKQDWVMQIKYKEKRTYQLVVKPLSAQKLTFEDTIQMDH
jgi:hypothetical protein